MTIVVWNEEPFSAWGGGEVTKTFHVDVPRYSKLYMTYHGSYLIYWTLTMNGQVFISTQFRPNVQEASADKNIDAGSYDGSLTCDVVETFGNPNPTGYVKLWIEEQPISTCMIAFLFGSTLLSHLFPYLRMFRDAFLPSIVTHGYYHFSRVVLHFIGYL
jgi:hypothetical protein